MRRTKVAGEEIAALPAQEPAHIINLMDALQASVANAEQQESAEAKPPPKRMEARAKRAEPGSGRVLDQ